MGKIIDFVKKRFIDNTNRSYKTSFKEDNNGYSMVMVIVVMGFVALLLSMLMYMALYNFQMRAADYQAQNTFYSAEKAMDEIKVGIETKVSTAVTKGYLDVMQNYSQYVDEERKDRFQYVFFSFLVSEHNSSDIAQSGLCYGGNQTGLYGIDMLKEFVSALVLSEGDSFADSSENCIKITSGDSNYESGKLVLYSDHITLQDVRVTYFDASNSDISIIQTDIDIAVPNIGVSDTLSMPQLVDYCMVANNGLFVSAQGVKIESSNLFAGAYKGKTTSGSSEDTGVGDGIYIGYSTTGEPCFGSLTFNNCDYIVSGGEIYIGGSQSYMNVVYDTSSATRDVTLPSVWASGIEVNASIPTGATISGFSNDSAAASSVISMGDDIGSYNLYINGLTYLSDDLNLSGNTAAVKLSGSYFGYGTGTTGLAANNSSININGVKTTLNLSGLKQLVLAGDAYIGTSDSDHFLVYSNGADAQNSVQSASLGTSTDLAVSNDIVMGESLASKANQIAYLVPPECIGWIAGGEKAIIGKNPVSQSEYNRYIENYAGGDYTSDKIVEVNIEQAIDSLGGAYLSDYFGLNSSGEYEDYYEVVIPQNTGWRYYYMNFKSEEAAGEFFKDYYQTSYEKMDAYISNYIKAFSINKNVVNLNGTVGDYRLNIAGNLLYPNTNYVEGTSARYILKSADDEDYTSELLSEYKTYGYSYDSLCRILSVNYSTMTSSQKSNDVFDNLIVDEDKMKSIVGNSTCTFYDGDTPRVYACATDSSNETIKISELADGICLVITRGDVIVDKSFEGTIIADGTVYIEKPVTIKSNEELVSSVLNLPNSDNTHSVANLFVEGEDFAVIDSSDDSGSTATVSVDNYVTYSNWTKK